MEQNSLEKKIPKQEQLALRIEIAGPEDWEEYKELVIEAFTGSQRELFTNLSPEQIKTRIEKSDEEWQRKLLPQKESFVLLAWDAYKAIGMSSAIKEEDEESWNIHSVYVKPEFRNKGVNQKKLAKCLDEIMRRGGTKATISTSMINDPQNHIVMEKFGFEKVRSWTATFDLELDLTDPGVIKKINEVLETPEKVSNER